MLEALQALQAYLTPDVVSAGSVLLSLAQWFRSERLTTLSNEDKQEKDQLAQYLDWLYRSKLDSIAEAIAGSSNVQANISVIVQELQTTTASDQLRLLGQVESHANTLLGRLDGLSEQISHLPEQISRLFPVQSNVVDTDNGFEKEYLAAVGKDLKTVSILGVSEMQAFEQELSIAYVSLSLTSQKRASSSLSSPDRQHPEEDFESLPAEEGLRQNPLLTIRGPAGSGKTTLMEWIALQCTLPGAWSGGIPFVIRLRRVPDGEPVIDEWVSHTVDTQFMKATYPGGWCQRILEAQRAVILIDGVDELAQNARPRF